MWNSENVCFKIIALFCTFIDLFLVKLSCLKELWANLLILQRSQFKGIVKFSKVQHEYEMQYLYSVLYDEKKV